MSPSKFIALATILIVCFASTARASPFYGHDEDNDYKEKEKHIGEKVPEKTCGLVCKIDHTKDKVINATKSAFNNTKEAIKNAGKKVQEIYYKKVEEHNARHHHKKELPDQYDKAEDDYTPTKDTSYGKDYKETDGYGKAGKGANTEFAPNNGQSGFNQAPDNSQSAFNSASSNTAFASNGAFPNGAFTNAAGVFDQAGGNADSGFPSGSGTTPSSTFVSGYLPDGTFNEPVFNPMIPAGSDGAASSGFNQGTPQGGGFNQNGDSGFQSGIINERGGSSADKTKQLLEKERHSSSY